jgi:hypothetical protein
VIIKQCSISLPIFRSAFLLSRIPLPSQVPPSLRVEFLMASLNLSLNGPIISKSYQSVVDAAAASPAAASPTYGQWALFTVSTPLVNAFQQDNLGKESVLKVQSTGGKCHRCRLKMYV